MINFYKKYINVIVVCLLFLLICKNCQSCLRANQIEWNQTQHNEAVDSLNNIIEQYKITNNNLLDTIMVYKEKINSITEENIILKESNKTQQATNRALINMNNNLNKQINN